MIALSPAARMILAVLQERPLTRAEIACQVEYSPGTVRDTVSSLFRIGKIRLGLGSRYVLVPWPWEDAVTRAHRRGQVLVLEYD